jgi:RimJ/RimL family protein N-acetyltransferase
MRITTPRLILRPLLESDEDDLFEYQSMPDIVRYIPWPERSREEVRAAIRDVLVKGKVSLKDENDFIVLVWELRESGKVIGQSNIGLQSVEHKRAEIGWVTHQDFQRQGIAYEATRALIDYAFENFDVHRMIANIDTRGTGSAMLAEKLGMRLEGTYRDGEFFKGAWCDMWLYAILKDENR